MWNKFLDLKPIPHRALSVGLIIHFACLVAHSSWSRPHHQLIAKLHRQKNNIKVRGTSHCRRLSTSLIFCGSLLLILSYIKIFIKKDPIHSSKSWDAFYLQQNRIRTLLSTVFLFLIKDTWLCLPQRNFCNDSICTANVQDWTTIEKLPLTQWRRLQISLLLGRYSLIRVILIFCRLHWLVLYIFGLKSKLCN